MAKIKDGAERLDFFANSFMMRLTAPGDAVFMCENIRDLLVKVHDVLILTSIPRSDYAVLEKVISCTEKVFAGEEREEFFDLFYRLGVVLLDLGEEDLGIACQYLHHSFRNRPQTSWPPAKAYNQGRGAEVKRMVPILKHEQGFLEIDTAIDIRSIPR